MPSVTTTPTAPANPTIQAWSASRPREVSGLTGLLVVGGETVVVTSEAEPSGRGAFRASQHPMGGGCGAGKTEVKAQPTRTVRDVPSTRPAGPIAATWTTCAPGTGTRIDVSNPAVANDPTGCSEAESTPARTSQRATPVAPFQLAAIRSASPDAWATTAGGVAGFPVHCTRNAR